MDAEGDKRRKLVVIGHGPTGHRLVEALRERDTAGGWHITVIGEETRPAYDRVALTSYLTEAAELAFPAHDPDVTLCLGDPVAGIDRPGRTVRTGSGATFDYDALVLATGSAPFVPPVEGKDLPGTFVYRTIDDLDSLRSYCADRAVPSGVVVGGGLLGLEAARALQGLGVDTHVVEVARWLMPRQLDEGGGAMLRRHIEALDLTVHAGTPMAGLEAGEDGAVARVRTQ